MGAMVKADNHAIQLKIKLVKVPWLSCGIRAEPPATGINTETSAKVNAIRAVAKPPISQAISAPGPAIWAAYKGANNQAEPTMPLMLTNSKASGEKRRLSLESFVYIMLTVLVGFNR